MCGASGPWVLFQRRAGLCLGLSTCLETPDAFTDPIAKGLLYVYSPRPKTRSGNPGQRHRICTAHPTLISHLLDGPSCSARLGLGFREQSSPSPNRVLQGHRAARPEQSQSRYPPDAPPSWLLPEATRVLRDALVLGCFCPSPRTSPQAGPAAAPHQEGASGLLRAVLLQSFTPTGPGQGAGEPTGVWLCCISRNSHRGLMERPRVRRGSMVAWFMLR